MIPLMGRRAALASSSARFRRRSKHTRTNSRHAMRSCSIASLFSSWNPAARSVRPDKRSLTSMRKSRQFMTEKAGNADRSRSPRRLSLWKDDFGFLFRGSTQDYPQSLEEMEKSHIERILRWCHWNISKVAGILEINRTTLHNKIGKYGLKN
ncbi:MAG: hypothetical protein HGA84_08585 [Syntrophobacteraceae bacterium]|nr:hypothetical protein [Syntrophobacteraceae bacterium]